MPRFIIWKLQWPRNCTRPKENHEILELSAEIKARKAQYIIREWGNLPRNSDHDKNAWKSTAPKNETYQIKLVNGNTFNWCMYFNHGSYTSAMNAILVFQQLMQQQELGLSEVKFKHRDRPLP